MNFATNSNFPTYNNENDFRQIVLGSFISSSLKDCLKFKFSLRKAGPGLHSFRPVLGHYFFLQDRAGLVVILSDLDWARVLVFFLQTRTGPGTTFYFLAKTGVNLILSRGQLRPKFPVMVLNLPL